MAIGTVVAGPDEPVGVVGNRTSAIEPGAMLGDTRTRAVTASAAARAPATAMLRRSSVNRRWISDVA